MVDFSSIAKGFRQQGIDDRATRKDIAETFAQFRKDNPYATLEDMQNQMSILSGNRNYLRAGLPDKDTLGRIAASNLEAKKVADFKTNLSQTNETRELRNSVLEDARKFFEQEIKNKGTLFGGATMERDVAQLKIDFAKSRGISTDPLDDPFGLYTALNDVFTIQNAENITIKGQAKAREDALPLVEQAIQDGDISEADIARIMRVTNIDKDTLVSSIVPMVEKAWKKRLGEEFLAIQPGVLAELDSFLAGMEEDWKAGKGGKLKGQATNYIKEYLNKLGVPIPSDKMITSLVNRKVDVIEAKWNKAKTLFEDEGFDLINQYNTEIKTSVIDDMRNPQSDIYVAYSEGKLKDVEDLIKQKVLLITNEGNRLKRYYPDEEERKAILDNMEKVIYDHLKVTVENMQENQRDANDKAAVDAEAQGNIKAEEFMAAQTERISENFGSVGSPNPNTTINNEQNGNVVTALNQMSKLYVMNQNVLNLVMDVLKDYPVDGGTNPGDIQDFLETQMGGILLPLNEHLNAIRENEKSKAGVMEEKTFSAWETKYKTDFEVPLSKIQSNINNVELDDPQGKQKLIKYQNQIQMTLDRALNFVKNSHNTHDKWITKGQADIWNPDVAWQTYLDVKSVLDELTKQAKEKMEQLTPPVDTTRGSLYDTEMTDVLANVGNTLNPDQARRQLKLMWMNRGRELATWLKDKGWADVKPRSENLNINELARERQYPKSSRHMFNFSYRSSKLGSSNAIAYDSNSPVKTEEHAIEIQEFLEDNDNVNIMLQSQSRIDEFKNNPIKYIENSEKDKDRYKDLLIDLEF